MRYISHPQLTHTHTRPINTTPPARVCQLGSLTNHGQHVSMIPRYATHLLSNRLPLTKQGTAVSWTDGPVRDRNAQTTFTVCSYSRDTVSRSCLDIFTCTCYVHYVKTDVKIPEKGRKAAGPRGERGP